MNYYLISYGKKAERFLQKLENVEKNCAVCSAIANIKYKNLIKLNKKLNQNLFTAAKSKYII